MKTAMHALHHVVQGQGPVVMLSHALGCDMGMWDEVAALLSGTHTVIRYDHRGHGASAGGGSPFSMDDLASDAASLIDALALGPVHFVGVSMGGMTAQALAARHPALVRSVTVAHAASHYDATARQGWQARIDTVCREGMAAVADAALQRWLSADYIAAHPARVAQLRATLLGTSATAYAHACEAVAAIDLQAGNARIRCPALVVAGARDQATPLACSQVIAAQIPGAQLAVIDTAHIGCVEQPAVFADLVRGCIARACGG